jgi:hypothetical protein
MTLRLVPWAILLSILAPGGAQAVTAQPQVTRVVAGNERGHDPCDVSMSFDRMLPDADSVSSEAASLVFSRSGRVIRIEHGLATIPSAADGSDGVLFHSERGREIVERPVWLFYTEGEMVPLGGVTATSAPGVFGSVVDSRSGDWLAGWGCSGAKASAFLELAR